MITIYENRQAFNLALAIALSTAGSIMSGISIATALFATNHSGIYTAYMHTVSLLGVVIAGMMGGRILAKYTAVNIGIIAAILSAAILFGLSALRVISVWMGLLSMLLLSLLNGIEHPNNMRVLNAALQPHEKAKFFSMYQTFMQACTIFSPMLAALLIVKFGMLYCFTIDAFTCLLSAYAWFNIKNVAMGNPDKCDIKKTYWIGYQQLWVNKNLMKLNIARMVNNICYVTFTVWLPMFIARIVQGDHQQFAIIQGRIQGIIGIGFIISGIAGTRLLHKYPTGVLLLIIMASVLGYIALTIGIFAHTENTLFFAALVIGCGHYCFRISGITLGQAITPPDMLGEVILAGDTVVRLFCFIIALLVPQMFYLIHHGVSDTILTALLGVSVFVSPFLLRQSFYSYRKSICTS